MTLLQAITKASRISINVYFGEESIPVDIEKFKAKWLMNDASNLCGVHYLDHKFDKDKCIYHSKSGAIIAMFSDEGTLAGYPENENIVLFLGV